MDLLKGSLLFELLSPRLSVKEQHAIYVFFPEIRTLTLKGENSSFYSSQPFNKAKSQKWIQRGSLTFSKKYLKILLITRTVAIGL
jgi:hypothetical protein